MDWIRFLTQGRGVPLLLYAAFQMAALLSLRGRWRVAASAPLLLFLLIGANLALANSRGQGVWLMILLMVAPGAVLAIAVVWTVEVAYCRRARSALALCALCALTALAVAGAQPASAIPWRNGWAVAWTIVTVFTLLGFGLVTSQLRR